MFKYFVSIFLFFVLDRFTKVYILKNPLPNFGNGFLNLKINQVAAFSLPVTYFVLYPIIIVILIFLFLWWFKEFKKKSILIWPSGLVIIGAISNLLDRLSYGGVVDFITVPYFTVFNLSDVYISIGVVWLLWHLWFYGKNLSNETT